MIVTQTVLARQKLCQTGLEFCHTGLGRGPEKKDWMKPVHL